MGLAVDGIVSGLDTSSIISSLVSAYASPQASLEDRLEEFQNKQEKFTELTSLLSDLTASLEAMDSSSEFRSYSATSSSEAISAVADGTAIAGTYQVEVSRLASVEMEASNGFSDTDVLDSVASGTYEVTCGGVTTSFTLESSSSSLDGLAAAINANVDGVSAYIVNNGDSTNPYQLVLMGTDTGSDNTIEIGTSGATGPGTVPLFTEMQAAGNAAFTVNGISIQSASNTVTDAIPGMTLRLAATTTSAATVTVDMDTDAITEAIEGFVEAYNAVVSYVSAQSAYNEDLGIRGAFVGESGVTRVMQGLSTIITSAYGDDSISLSQVGITTNSSTGALSLDTSVLLEALNDDFTVVEDIFTSTDGFAETLLERIDLYVDDGGTLAARADSLESRISSLQDQIDSWDARIERYEQRLTRQFTALETTLGMLQASEQHLIALFPTSDDSA